MKILRLIPVLFLLLFLCGCVDPFGVFDPFETEAFAELTESLSESVEIEKVPDDGVLVYWTESGSVYHIEKDCSSIRDSSELIVGSVYKAEMSGKTRPCSRCGGE